MSRERHVHVLPRNHRLDIQRRHTNSLLRDTDYTQLKEDRSLSSAALARSNSDLTSQRVGANFVRGCHRCLGGFLDRIVNHRQVGNVNWHKGDSVLV